MATAPASPSQNAILISGLVIVLSVLGTYFFLLPQLTAQRTTLETTKASLEGLTADQTTLTNAGEQITAAEQQLQVKGVDLTKLAAIYPANEDMPGLYIQLESLMAQAGSVGVTATYQVSNPSADTDGSAKIPLSFTATGTFENLRKFITLLENNTRPILLSSISFDQAANTSTTSPQLSLTATGYTKAAAISGAYAAPSH